MYVCLDFLQAKEVFTSHYLISSVHVSSVEITWSCNFNVCYCLSNAFDRLYF